MNAAEAIAALRATHEAATEGPWMYGTPDEGCVQTSAEWMAECAKEPDGSAAGSLWVAWQQRDGELFIPAITGDGPTSERNAAAIVSVHNSLPALLKALEDVLEIARREPHEVTCRCHIFVVSGVCNCWKARVENAVEAALAEVQP